MLLTNQELLQITGGATGITAAMLNAVARGVSVLYSLGRALGSAVRYAIGKKYC